MKINSKLNKLFCKFSLFAVVVFLMVSCEKNDKFDADIASQEYMVSENASKAIAENILFSQTPVNDKLQKGKVNPDDFRRKVESVFTVSGSEDLPAYHIISYEDSGFVILSGDKRFEPILAFSSSGDFPTDSETYPIGLSNWMQSMKAQIEQIRNGHAQVPQGLSARWENIENYMLDIFNNDFFEYNTNAGLKRLPEPDPEEPGGPGDPNDPYDCETTITQKGPLLQTQWHQGIGFNSALDPLSCGKPPAGCVAVAMAQIMKYYEYPSSYDWANMPNTYGTTATAYLLRDIGIEVDMDYTCNGSYANASTKAVPAFKNYFGYSSASFAGYNYLTVKNQISYNRPVVLVGYPGPNQSGHAWVCDGYLQIFNPCSYSVLQLHMKWGWSTVDYDGWYYYNNFNPENLSYNYNIGMVYNIHP